MNANLSPGIREPLCGWQWFEEHKNDPPPEIHIELVAPGVRHTMTVKKPKTVDEIANMIKNGGLT
jgi:hypothetical protein